MKIFNNKSLNLFFIISSITLLGSLYLTNSEAWANHFSYQYDWILFGSSICILRLKLVFWIFVFCYIFALFINRHSLVYPKSFIQFFVIRFFLVPVLLRELLISFKEISAFIHYLWIYFYNFGLYDPLAFKTLMTIPAKNSAIPSIFFVLIIYSFYFSINKFFSSVNVPNESLAFDRNHRPEPNF